MPLDATLPANLIRPVFSSILKLFPVEVTLCFLSHGCGFDQVNIHNGMHVLFHIPRDLFIAYNFAPRGTNAYQFRIHSRSFLDIVRNGKSDAYYRIVYEDGSETLIFETFSLDEKSSEHELTLNTSPRNSENAFDEITNRIRELARPDPMWPERWFPLGKFRNHLASAKMVTDRMTPPALGLRREAHDETAWKMDVFEKNSYKRHEYLMTTFGKIGWTAMISNPLEEVAENTRAYFWPLLNVNMELCRHHARVRISPTRANFVIRLDWNVLFQINFIAEEYVKNLKNTVSFQQPQVNDEIDELLHQIESSRSPSNTSPSSRSSTSSSSFCSSRYSS